VRTHVGAEDAGQWRPVVRRIQQRCARLCTWQAEERADTPHADVKPLALPLRRTLLNLEGLVKTDSKLLAFEMELDRPDAVRCADSTCLA
jgi:hypothetical protein